TIALRGHPQRAEQPKWRSIAFTFERACTNSTRRRQPRPRAVARDRKHPCKRAFDQYRRLNFIREKPAKLNAPFLVVLLLDDLLGTGELFVARHLVDRRTEILGRESSKPDGVKTLS